MGYIEQNLVPGETVLYKTNLHWIVMIWPLLAGLLLGGTGVALIVARYENNLEDGPNTTLMIGGLALLAVALVLVVVGFIRKHSTEVAVSNKRVLIKTGIAARKSIEVLLTKVESIGVDEPLLGRMLGYGSVVVRGTGGTFETFSRIAHPNEFRRQVQQQIGSVEGR
jgi:uncharacterized membrane protein YdbT with pleckstrin-like domain